MTHIPYHNFASLLCLFLALCVMVGCGDEWKKKAETAYQAGEALLESSDFDRARLQYETALIHNPYHIGANLRLGELMEMRFLDEKQALHYYRRALNLPLIDIVLKKRLAVLVDLLTQIENGQLEDPAYTVNDMVWAAKNGSNRDFIERVNPSFIQVLFQRGKPATKYFEDWKQRAATSSCNVLYRNVYKSRGRHRAILWVDCHTEANPKQYRKLTFTLDGALWELVGDEALKQ